MLPIDWTLLMPAVRSMSGGSASPEEARAALEAFKLTATRPQYGWHRCGLPHEKAADPGTWGPMSPNEIDWRGF